MKFSRIIGTGSYLPEKILTNHDIEKIVNTTNEWIVERTGIKQRHIAAVGETSGSMGAIAAQQAINAAEIDKNSIDLIIVATSTGDKIFPSTACLIQEKLGINDCPAFDINAACAGFNYALGVADQFIRTGSAKTALVIGAEVMSRIIDWQDRSTCVIFADGAGAVLLSQSDTPGIHSTHLHADGKYQDLLFTPSGLAHTGEVIPSYMKMEGREVFKVAVTNLGKIVQETLEKNNLTKTAIDWLIPHQANMRIITAMAKKLDLPLEKVIITIAEHGNTSAASIPLALDTGIRDGRIKRGETLLLESFGGGFTWGSALITY